MLVTCCLGEPLKLWETHKESMSEDIIRRIQRECSSENVDIGNIIFNEALIDLDNRVQTMGGQGIATFGLPPPEQATNNLTGEYMREISYNTEEMRAFVSDNEHRLNEDQMQAYNAVISSIEGVRGGLFFLHATGGTGKTFIINLLRAKLRQSKQVALAVASSGISATLLTGGRTAHSSFKLPLDLSKKEQATCNISRGSMKGKLLSECKLIIWDEATMSHKGAFEALDRVLQDIRHNTRLMGGVTVLLAGDFRQTLPVIPKGTRADEVSASIKSSYLWSSVNKLRLRTNMRVQLSGDEQAGTFSLAADGLG